MTLKQLAMDERSRFPRAAETTEQAFYTDDLIYGAHSIEEGCSMVTELQDLLHAGGFKLRKWAFNEPSILKRLSEKMNREQNQQIFTFKGDPISKTLGVYWNPKEDCFMFQSSFDFSNKTTKRALLSDISKLFDPLGWLAPAITAKKIIFQEIQSLIPLSKGSIESGLPKQYLVNIVQSKDSIVKEIIENCSSFSRAKRERHLTLAEVKEAKWKIISQVQEEEFSYEIEKLRRKESIHKSKLIALNPFLGKDGLLRVGGRLRNAFISEDMQHPIIISHAGRLTDLIIDQAHKLTFHSGPRLTLSLIRQKYWIVGSNRAVKRQLRLCVTCVKNNPRLQYQLMGDLPEARCNPVRPFKHTGVDFTGFIMIKSSKGRGMKCTKGYIAVFICMATKAVHLEVVSDLTTSAFLADLKRIRLEGPKCTVPGSSGGRNNRRFVDYLIFTTSV
ncbi:uncharacterized protein LOC123690182 [Pieris rapae]|uniref:uncharacterized protein LOC123690182 n=1 Tax=Pieris rapae TaxID=64459 RepID=UPI001E281448|nr:uncharacterized protein LOC123690182 [Pieris rapae]